MRDLKVYVSGVSGVVGYGIVRNLKRAYPNTIVYGTALDHFNIGAQIVDFFSICPRSDSESYISWLSEFIETNRIDFAIPGIDVDMNCWNLNRDVFSDAGCIPVLNDSKLIQLTENKFKFFLEVNQYQFAHTIPTRDSGTFDELCQLFGASQFIAKPKVGFAKKGFREISSKSDFEELTLENPDGLIFQPNLYSDGYEYTSSVFGDGKGGFSSIISLHRRLAGEGYSNYACSVNEMNLSSAILDYCNVFKPIGPTNFQFMVKTEKLYLLEINPRFSSSTSMRAVLGYNESKMAIDYFEHGALPVQPAIANGSVIRFIEDFYVPG
jgi:carbamoyl-phosphate synthase large subunit